MWNTIEGNLITTSINKSYYFQVKIDTILFSFGSSVISSNQDAKGRASRPGIPVHTRAHWSMSVCKHLENHPFSVSHAS